MDNKLARMMDMGKLPPQAVDLEEVVLGAALLEKRASQILVANMKPEMFYKEAHQIISEAIIGVFRSGSSVDLMTVTERIKQMESLELVGGAFFITQLTNRVASGENIEFHIKILQQKFLKRELIKISSTSLNNAYEDSKDVFDLMDDLVMSVLNVNNVLGGRKVVHIGGIAEKNMTRITDIKANKVVIEGVPTGYIELDEIMFGFHRTDFVVVAARPGMGKTAFMLCLVNNIAIENDIPVALFSLEMSSEQLEMRLKVMRTQIDNSRVRKARELDEADMLALQKATKEIQDAPFFVDDTPAINLIELRSKAMEVVRTKGVKAIFLDYLQLMSGMESRRKVWNRENEISEISRGMKAIAKDLDIPVIALSQLNRKLEERADKRPKLSDLRESGSIEQDSDIVMFIYREEVYRQNDEYGLPTEGKANIIISKHRNGALADIPLMFKKNTMTFTGEEEMSF
jgi:replicative DNA helicase